MGEVRPRLESKESPREGRGRVGRADREPPGLAVGLYRLPSSDEGNFKCFILNSVNFDLRQGTFNFI